MKNLNVKYSIHLKLKPGTTQSEILKLSTVTETNLGCVDSTKSNAVKNNNSCVFVAIMETSSILNYIPCLSLSLISLFF